MGIIFESAENGFYIELQKERIGKRDSCNVSLLDGFS